jgi:hypothetical protein
MKTLTRLAMALTICLSLIDLAGSATAAHHGWADYDRTKTVEISGVVVESKYENPHCYVKIRVEQDVWEVELSALPRMKRKGLSAEMISPGNTLKLTGHPHKEKAHEMKATLLVRDGKTFDLLQ